MTMSITIASGKGGVGKTSISVNLALALRQTGAKVCLLDTDFGLANAHIMLGINPKQSIADVINGTATLPEIRCKAPLDLNFISGGSGLNDLLNIDNKTRYQIIQATEQLADDTDILLVDAPAGAADSAIAFVAASEKPTIVLVGEPTSFMDAYALIKAANIEAGVEAFSIIVNMANGEAEALKHFNRFQEITSRFLNVKLQLAGYLPYSQAIRQSIVNRTPIMASRPDSREAMAFQKIAKSLISAPVNQIRGLQFLDRRTESKAS
jgi:flagellar biosynthesis protein FlhG